MESYVELNLINNEQVQYEGKISFWSLLPEMVFGLFLLPFYGAGLIFWVSALITYFTTELVITNKRVIGKFGSIRRKTIAISLSKVEKIRIDQGVLGRLFNFGSILIAEAGDPKTAVSGICHPLKFRNMFFKIQEKMATLQLNEAAV